MCRRETQGTPHNRWFIQVLGNASTPRLSVCRECKVNYGSCNLFFECEMQVNELKRTCLRSKTIDPKYLGIDDSDNVDEDEHDEVAAELLVKGSIVALAAYDKDRDSFYLLKIVKEEQEQILMMNSVM